MHILWLKTELLHPVDKGGRIRSYNMLRELCRDNRVTYLTLDDGNAARDADTLAKEYCHELIRIPFSTANKRSVKFFAELAANVVSPLPYAVAKYRSSEMEQAIKKAVGNGVDIVVCDFLFPSLNVPDGLGVPTVLFQHNVEAMIWERHAQVAGNGVKGRYMRSQWQRMERHEAAECRRFDHVVAVSVPDAEMMAKNYGVKSVSDVPTGVDINYFQADERIPQKTNNLVFTGSMDWLPNEDAILWFVDSILPLVRASVPDVSLTVVGRNPPPRISALNGAGGVEVTGSVPDVRPYLNRAQVFVVPIRIGGGTRLKIYEAMSMRRAVVSTPIGAEGLPVTNDVHVRLRETPHKFANAIVELLKNESLRNEIAGTGCSMVRGNFGWDGVARNFSEMCLATIKRSSNRAAT